MSWKAPYRLYPWCPCDEKCGTQDPDDRLCDTCGEVVLALNLATAKEQPRVVHSVIPPKGKHMIALDVVEPDGHIVGGTQLYFESMADAQKFIFFMCSPAGAEIKNRALVEVKPFPVYRTQDSR